MTPVLTSHWTSLLSVRESHQQSRPCVAARYLSEANMLMLTVLASKISVAQNTNGHFYLVTETR